MSQDVERWKRELTEAGWTAASATAWYAPDGGLYRGPYGAWKELQRRNGGETVSHDTQVKQEAPERIWLIENNDPDATAETEILWSSAPSDAENDLNVEYVRADLLATARKEAFKEAQRMMDAPAPGTMASTEFHKGLESMRRLAKQVLDRAALQASASGRGEMNGC